MKKQFPKEFAKLWSVPGVKAVFVSDITPINPFDCENCGGAGVMAIFIAKKGPFQAPGSPYSANNETSHWDQSAIGGRGGWWVGETFTATCPTCNGQQKPITVKQFPVGDAMRKMETR